MRPFALCPLQSYDCSVSDSALPLSIARQWIVSPQVAPCPIKDYRSSLLSSTGSESLELV